MPISLEMAVNAKKKFKKQFTFPCSVQKINVCDAKAEDGDDYCIVALSRKSILKGEIVSDIDDVKIFVQLGAGKTRHYVRPQ